MMADFVRFRTKDGTVLVNVDAVAFVFPMDEERTRILINVPGYNCIDIIEPFEDVAAKLNRLF